MEPESPSPYPQVPATTPEKASQLMGNFNMCFYGEVLLTPRPTTKLEDQPFRLSAAAYGRE
jgi:hypothetical protein